MGVAMRYGSGGSVGGAEKNSGGVQLTKLWANNSPTSNFTAQTISVDLTGCDLYAVQLRFSTGYDYGMEMMFFPVDERQNNLTVVTIAQNRTGGRHCQYSIANKEMTFDGASYNGSSNNSYAIPLAIWGVKL